MPLAANTTLKMENPVTGVTTERNSHLNFKDTHSTRHN